MRPTLKRELTGIVLALLAVFVAGALVFQAVPDDVSCWSVRGVFGPFGTCLKAGIVALIGLTAAWLIPLAWVVCFAVNLAWLAVQIRHSWMVLDTAGSSDVIALFVMGAAISTALHLPLFLGLVRYAFFSPSIWRPQAPRTEPDAA